MSSWPGRGGPTSCPGAARSLKFRRAATPRTPSPWPRQATYVAVVWGLWHAPLILLGYNHARPDVAGLAYMVVFSVLTGVLLGALRLWSGSLWPAVAAHAAIKASVGEGNELLLLSLSTVDPAEATLLGWPGWLLLGALAAALGAHHLSSKSHGWTDPSARCSWRPARRPGLSSAAGRRR